jgi:peptidoglycan/xylan/chitin deacetylase (PgdA/CDA1 family)
MYPRTSKVQTISNSVGDRQGPASDLTGQVSQDRYLFILTFHGLGHPPRTLPAEEEECWVETQTFASILDVVKGRGNARITFDDANESDYTIALPLLCERKLSATFFVVSDRIDQPGYLSRAQIQELQAAGMTIGSHGKQHRMWTQLPVEQLHEEIVNAKSQLERICGQSITEAACPFGAYNRTVLRKLRESGFLRIYTSDGGPASVRASVLARNTVVNSDDAHRAKEMVTDVPRGPRAIWRHSKLAFKRWR